MKITALTPEAVEQQSRNSVFDRLARKSLFNLLDNLKGGTFSISESGETIVFGNTSIDESDTAPCEPIHAHITVNNPSVYRMMAKHGLIGAGEAFMMNFWQTPDLTAVVRLMCRNMVEIERLDGGLTAVLGFGRKLKHWFSPNTIKGAKKNIHAHYDLGNELFETFLDSRMMYSSAVYPAPDSTLETAAEFKLQLIGEKLGLSASDHVLEIGSGWGGLAVYLAEKFGCKVTTTTISEQQYCWAENAIRQKGLGHLVTLLKKDYRLLEGKFDKLVSIEMIEAVGLKYLSVYFEKCDALLKQGGEMLIQAITVPEQRYQHARSNVDFIQQYIFPGGSLPSIEAMLHATGRYSHLQLDNIQDIGIDYATTLKQWRQRFLRQPELIRSLGFDDVFIRLWQFYLCYCEGGFRERTISTHQLVFRKA